MHALINKKCVLKIENWKLKIEIKCKIILFKMFVM